MPIMRPDAVVFPENFVERIVRLLNLDSSKIMRQCGDQESEWTKIRSHHTNQWLL